MNLVIERYGRLTTVFLQMDELVRMAATEEETQQGKTVRLLAAAALEAKRIESDAIVRLKEMFREVICSRHRNIGLR